MRREAERAERCSRDATARSLVLCANKARGVSQISLVDHGRALGPCETRATLPKTLETIIGWSAAGGAIGGADAANKCN